MPIEKKLKRLQVLALVCALISLIVIVAMYGRIRSLQDERNRMGEELQKNLRMGARIVEIDKE